MYDSSFDSKLVDWLELIFPDCAMVAGELSRTLDENPGRISRAYRSLLEGYLCDPEAVIKVTLELPKQDYAGLVASTNMPFLSFCAHHFLPFFGTIDIVYEPGPYIIGIGKMPRLVDCRAKRFELQETLVKHLCDDMMLFAKARGAYVRSVARHLCVCYRGPAHYPTFNQTTYALGSLTRSDRLPEVLSIVSTSQR